MKVFERNLSKKASVLVGAMILSMAMGTVAYAGTSDNANDEKMTDSIPATLCTEAIKGDANLKALPEGVKMTAVETTPATEVTLTDKDKVVYMEKIDVNGTDVVSMKKIELDGTETDKGIAYKLTPIESTDKGNVYMTKIHMDGTDMKVIPLDGVNVKDGNVEVTLKATPIEKIADEK